MDASVAEVIINFISSVGFPIACCIYMMVQTNKSMNELKDSVNELILTLKSMKK